MVEESAHRRLATIVSADVVGYSRLMETDEAVTLASLKARRASVLEPLVARYAGRIFHIAGDGVLAEFASAVNAVQCAIDIQQGMKAANDELAEGAQIVLRIGVNLGDVMVEGDDLYGDGVNVAARLQSLAEPGGILVSGAAHDFVRNKVKVGFDDLGPQVLKNIAEPVRAYRVNGLPVVTGLASKPGLDRPSIAVLPFFSLGGGEDQQYFGDGITEDVITELSRFRQLRIVARNSSFRYRGMDVDVGRVARELGVQYVLEGSVRRFGDRIRITAQLIDATSGHHLWADRFDRHQEELFDVQDQVVRTIVGTLVGRVMADSTERAKRKPPANLAAYECVLRGDALPVGEPQSEIEARRLFERAIEIDPGYAKAYALLAASYCREWTRGGGESEAALEQALALAKRGVEIDDSQETCLMVTAWVHLLKRSFDLAEHYYRRALERNPNSPMVLAHFGDLLVSLGEPAKGLQYLKEVKALDPYFDPSWYWPMVGAAYFQLREYDEAIAALNRTSNKPLWVRVYLAASCAQSGKFDAASDHAAEIVRLVPGFSIARYAARETYKKAADLEHFVEGLTKAGLPA